jgi:hypothetical protein
MTTLNALKLAMLVLALSLVSIPLYSSRQQDSAQQPGQPPSAQSSPVQGQQVQSFSGTIVKGKSGLALKDTASSTTYKLENEGQAKAFVGKNVTVTGTMDPTSNKMIHVTSIEAASSSN